MKATQPYKATNPPPGRYHSGHRPMDNDDHKAIIALGIAWGIALLWFLASR